VDTRGILSSPGLALQRVHPPRRQAGNLRPNQRLLDRREFAR
jgi:hypothetical protein